MILGSIAAELYTARVAQAAAETRIEQFVAVLMPVGHRGIKYAHDPSGAMRIDVFDVPDSAPAARALHLAGFALVILHQHPTEKLITCQCRPHEAP